MAINLAKLTDAIQLKYLLLLHIKQPKLSNTYIATRCTAFEKIFSNYSF